MTTSRADYGLLRGLLSQLAKDETIQLQVIAGGSHLSVEAGHTVESILSDGFTIAAQVPCEAQDDTRPSIATAAGEAVGGFARAFGTLSPDIIVVLGDRYEVLAAAMAATICGVPLAHIHGGEVTVGAFDDAMRHAVTKLSLVHFVAAEPYRWRVIQMGEHPDLVFTVGAPGIDELLAGECLSREETCQRLKIPENARYFLVTVHPTTGNADEDSVVVPALRAALGGFAEHHVIITGVNQDPGHSALRLGLEDYARVRSDRVSITNSLGTPLYLNALRHADAVIGNSSSGIIEAPAALVPTINIGSRQDGRLRARSIIDCAVNAEAIAQSITEALDPEFGAAYRKAPLPYGAGGAATKMAGVLGTILLDLHWPKRFHDLAHPDS